MTTQNKNNVKTYKYHQKHPQQSKRQDKAWESGHISAWLQWGLGRPNKQTDFSATVDKFKLSVRSKHTTSLLYKHHLYTGHRTDFYNCKQIAGIQHNKIRLITEAIEIETSQRLQSQIVYNLKKLRIY